MRGRRQTTAYRLARETTISQVSGGEWVLIRGLVTQVVGIEPGGPHGPSYVTRDARGVTGRLAPSPEEPCRVVVPGTYEI